MTPDRRAFLRSGVAALGALVVPGAGCARRGAAPVDAGAATHPDMRVSLAEWSFHRKIRAGALDPLDFAPFARERFGLDTVEHVNQFFAGRKGDDAYFGEMRRRADDAGVRSLLVMCDVEERLGDPDAARRALAVHVHRAWLDAAAVLGCESIRVNAASDERLPADEQMRLCAEGLYRLCDAAAPYQLRVLVENHGGLSSRGDWLAALVQAVAHPRIGTLPDFGNWQYAPGEWYDRYRGVAELMPWAGAVSVKSHDFDAAGNETTTDFARMLRIVADAGYDGWLGVEYEGDRLSEEDGVRATIELVRRVAPLPVR